MKRLTPKTRKALLEAFAAADICSNCCYNLSQRAGSLISEQLAKGMKQYCDRWDDARMALPEWLRREIFG